MHTISTFWTRWGTLFPQDCTLCGARSPGVLCTACREDLPRAPALACWCCGEVLRGAHVEPRALCGACLAAPPEFTHTVLAGAYAFPLDRLIQAWKFRARLALSDEFAEALAARVREDREDEGNNDARPQCLLPLPLGAKRLAERGFNPAALLARALGRTLNIPVELHTLVRTRETRPQSGLDHTERQRNVRGAFATKADLTGRHVVVVDDVMTTGATLSAAAHALRRAGAARVDAWVLARTQERGS